MPHTELLLKAARKAYPGNKWVSYRGGCAIDGDGSCSFSLESLADQMALQIALEREGWEFWYWKDDDTFRAWKLHCGEESLGAKTKPELLLSCIEGGS